MFEQIKNRGRWGADDQLGAANLIAEPKRRQALTLARTGYVVSLTHPLITKANAGKGDPFQGNGTPFEHTMEAGSCCDTYKIAYHSLINHDLEAAAETAAALKRWEFLVSIAPLPVEGGTGSPFWKGVGGYGQALARVNSMGGYRSGGVPGTGAFLRRQDRVWRAATERPRVLRVR